MRIRVEFKIDGGPGLLFLSEKWSPPGARDDGNTWFTGWMLFRASEAAVMMRLGLMDSCVIEFDAEDAVNPEIGSWWEHWATDWWEQLPDEWERLVE